jgi:hypothetical protein
MKTICRRGIRIGVFLFILGFAGCGERELPKRSTYPTRGRVLWKGKPVRFVGVHLEPLDLAQGLPADGSTQADGTFEIRTYSNAEPDGAVPGQYKLQLGDSDNYQFLIPKGEKATQLPKEILDSERIVEIEAGDNDLQIDL